MASDGLVHGDHTGSGRKLVLVAGTGRSGTSTVAGILRRLGLHVPQPEVMTDETNPKGFGESQWVVDFHTELLDRANVLVSDARPAAWERTSAFAERPDPRRRLAAWLEEQFDRADALLVKDPRLSWFLPLWTSVARENGVEPSLVTMLRPPPEVVGSKRTYYNARLQDAHGVAAWLNMMLNTERATRGTERAMVRYHDLLADWQPVTNTVCADLGLPTTLDPDVKDEINGFVDPGLRRISLSWDDLDLPERLAGMAQEAWECLDSLAGSDPDPDVRARLDHLHAAYGAYYLEAEVVSHSSVIAVRTAENRRRQQAAVPPRAAAGVLAASAVRRLPRWLRRLVPERIRSRALARLHGR